MNRKFKGLGVAMITPFKNDLSIDFPALRNLTNFLIDDGVDYLVVMGTTQPLTRKNNDKSWRPFCKPTTEKNLSYLVWAAIILLP
jgi:hypothetical protein